jgi:hypothetical protein
LTEHWQQHFKTSGSSDPIVMQDLLAASMISIDTNNLTTRFAPRVEAALKTLCERGIVSEARPLSKVEKTRAQWGKEWLQARWSILPPIEMHLVEQSDQEVPLSIPQETQRRRKAP